MRTVPSVLFKASERFSFFVHTLMKIKCLKRKEIRNIKASFLSLVLVSTILQRVDRRRQNEF